MISAFPSLLCALPHCFDAGSGQPGLLEGLLFCLLTHWAGDLVTFSVVTEYIHLLCLCTRTPSWLLLLPWLLRTATDESSNQIRLVIFLYLTHRARRVVEVVDSSSRSCRGRRLRNLYEKCRDRSSLTNPFALSFSNNNNNNNNKPV
jgi:hypothetical protein